MLCIYTHTAYLVQSSGQRFLIVAYEENLNETVKFKVNKEKSRVRMLMDASDLMQMIFSHYTKMKVVFNEIFTERVDQAYFLPRTQSNQQADRVIGILARKSRTTLHLSAGGVIKCCGVIGWRDRRSYIAPPRSWSGARVPADRPDPRIARCDRFVVSSAEIITIEDRHNSCRSRHVSSFSFALYYLSLTNIQSTYACLLPRAYRLIP